MLNRRERKLRLKKKSKPVSLCLNVLLESVGHFVNMIACNKAPNQRFKIVPGSILSDGECLTALTDSSLYLDEEVIMEKPTDFLLTVSYILQP